ncbi:MAG: Maf family protein [Oscillospiraceae bacterium]
MNKIILASASPRRRELLGIITPNFTVKVSSTDESKVCADTPCALAELIALAKCKDIALQNPDDIIIGCDTVVDLNGKVFGKPHTKQEAKEMLCALSDNSHFVHTGVAIYKDGEYKSFTKSSAVYFAPIPAFSIDAYIDTSEPYDKAGGYGIQGWAAKYTYRIEGCYYNIMGFPVAAVFKALQELDIAAYLDLQNF